MMSLTQITELAGADTARKRIGRGAGSGKGKTSGRGHNGAHSRSGWRRRSLSEGGQMPTFRRLPKRGFNNAQFRTLYHIVNVGDLESRFEAGDEVTTASLIQAGLVRHAKLPIKVLGNGTLSKKLVVTATKFSETAARKITLAGGEVKTA